MQFLRLVRQSFSIAVLAASLAANIACAFNQLDVDQPSVTVAPRISSVGATRTIFANGCTGSAVLDEAKIRAGRLIVRINPSAFNCALSPRSLTYVPRTVGKLSVLMMLPDSSVVAETSMETAAAVRSTVNLDGMWFDPDTNGSGISFHHSSGPDSIFGTWFMYNNAGEPRWYSLQSASWQVAGNVLEGLLLGFDGVCQTPSLAACPARGRPQQTRAPSYLSFLPFDSPPAFVRITFQSATRARAEVSSLDGTRLFTSELTKLAY